MNSRSDIDGQKYQAYRDQCDANDNVVLHGGQQQDQHKEPSFMVYFCIVSPPVFQSVPQVLKGAQVLVLYDVLVSRNEFLHFILHAQQQAIVFSLGLTMQNTVVDNLSTLLAFLTELSHSFDVSSVGYYIESHLQVFQSIANPNSVELFNLQNNGILLHLKQGAAFIFPYQFSIHVLFIEKLPKVFQLLVLPFELGQILLGEMLFPDVSHYSFVEVSKSFPKQVLLRFLSSHISTQRLFITQHRVLDLGYILFAQLRIIIQTHQIPKSYSQHIIRFASIILPDMMIVYALSHVARIFGRLCGSILFNSFVVVDSFDFTGVTLAVGLINKAKRGTSDEATSIRISDEQFGHDCDVKFLDDTFEFLFQLNAYDLVTQAYQLLNALLLIAIYLLTHLDCHEVIVIALPIPNYQMSILHLNRILNQVAHHRDLLSLFPLLKQSSLSSMKSTTVTFTT